MDLEEIKTCIKTNNFINLSRSDEVESKYTTHRENILTEWVSMEDYLKVKYFGAAICYNDLGQSVNKKCAILKSNPVVWYSLQLNEFPYNIKENIQHYVLWSLKSLSHDEICRLLLLLIGDDNENMCWFEQSIDQKSIKGIWHIHIFYKNSSK